MKLRSFDRGTYQARTLVLCLGGFFVLCSLLWAEDVILIKELGKPAARLSIAAEDEQIEKKEFGEGAALKTDPELERLLKRAAQFAESGRYDLATVLWQKVLEESGDILRTEDGQIYTSMAAEVERTLGRLPAEGLKVYRISADGEARAIMATINEGVDEEEALTKIVRRYFMSSLGDDAAYRLGCLALDRHDFVGASRMFSAILEQHPDPSIPRADLLLRAAVASARVGDLRVAQQAMEGVDKATGARPPREAIAAVKAFVAQADQSAIASSRTHDWRMAYGNASRTGHMKTLPKAAAEADLAELWTQEFDVLLPQSGNVAANNRGGAVMMGFGGPVMIRSSRGIQMAAVQPDTRENLVKRWKENGWFPTTQLLFDADETASRVYVKTPTELICWDANRLGDEPLWRSAWLNMYQPDSGSNMYMTYRNQGMQLQTQGPQSLGEILHFGDRVHQSMAISGDLIFNLEGPQISRKTLAPVSSELSVQVATPFTYGAVPRRSRRNWLAAYEARTGKARWYRSADDSADKEAGKPSSEIGFLAAPTPYGNLLLVPVTDGGAIWLYALSRQDGKTVWKSFLCDEPQGGAGQWSTVGLAVEGREAYVCCGTGAVFAVDAVSGVIRLAVRYERSTENDNSMINIYGRQNAMKRPLGFQDDVVIPYGKYLIVMASDSNDIFAIDRRTGTVPPEAGWKQPRVSPLDGREALYPIGMVGQNLFVAGRDVVRKYDVLTGKLMAERVLNELPRQADALSFGRGCLTEDALYLPVKDSVLKLSTKNLADISQVGVSTVSGDPTGNLFADGEKLWVAGASKVYALTNFERRMAELSTKIEAGDHLAQLIRMRMQFTLGRVDDAIADLEGAHRLVLERDRVEATRILLESIKELQLASTQPQTALRLLAGAFIDSAGNKIDVTEGDADRAAGAAELTAPKDELIYAALTTIRSQKVRGLVEPILRLTPIMEQDYLLHTARRTLATTATSDDADALLAALASPVPGTVAVAADTLGRTQGGDHVEPLTKLLASEHEAVRLASATGVLNLGDKAGLPVLIELLSSGDRKVAQRASNLLRQASGKSVPFSVADADLRKQSIATWKQWLDEEAAESKLQVPLSEEQPLLGRTLICYYALGKVEELDDKNQVKWSAQVQGVWSGVGLPNGHRLLALYAQRKIVELNAQGEEIWKLEDLPGMPYHVRRLDDGNTLVACSDSQRVIEFTPDKKEAWSATLHGRPMHATKLENGNLLVAFSQSGRVAEYSINDKGETKEVWAVDGMPGAMSAERLDNGNTLIACTGRGVIEVDVDKKQVWTVENLRNTYDAQRLPNGNTLITEQTRVQEFDVNKKVIWQHTQTGSSSARRF